MAERTHHETDDVRGERINNFVRLAIKPPEENLLRVHFEACSDHLEACSDHLNASSTPLSTAQQRWVMTNLEANPAWQNSWRNFEKSLGRTVSWNSSGSLRYGHPRARFSTHRRAAASILVGALVYGALWFGGRATLPKTYVWASLEGYETHLDQEARGSGTESQSAFASAAEALVATQISTFGLFPQYDQSRVSRAAQYLEVAYTATSDPFQRAEIAFFLAKTSLMKNDVPIALEWLERVQAQNVADYRADSQLLLDAIAARI